MALTNSGNTSAVGSTNKSSTFAGRRKKPAASATGATMTPLPHSQQGLSNRSVPSVGTGTGAGTGTRGRGSSSSAGKPKPRMINL